MEPDNLDERILVLAPTGRDADLACEILSREGLTCANCQSVEGLCREAERGVGVLLVAKEALLGTGAEPLIEGLGRQEPWSDIPLVVLTGGGAITPAGLRLLAAIRPLGNVTLVERPVRIATLVSALRAALAARRRQYQVRDLLRQLGEAVRRRDEFLAMLGHELRNPLAAIRNATALIDRARLPDPDDREAHEILERQSGHLNRIVNDLLDVTRVNSGKVVLNRRPEDLGAIARRALQALDEDGKVQKHHITLSLEPEPVMVDGDALRLEQILTNLVSNAVKYTPMGGRIDVSVRRTPDRAEVRVADNGVGIAPEMLGQIFEPFAQVCDSLERAPGGFGIGLALVGKLVTLHGGTVEARSEGLGRGSEFLVRFPLAVGPGFAAPTAREAGDLSPRGEPAPQAFHARHILIVEDHPDNRRTLRALLRTWGHRVEVAEDGSRGVEMALAIRPELAIIDIGLPGLDGYEVARRVRAAIGDQIFLIALTGYGQPEDRLRALTAGFDAHMAKPINVEDLGHLLEEAGASRTT